MSTVESDMDFSSWDDTEPAPKRVRRSGLTYRKHGEKRSKTGVIVPNTLTDIKWRKAIELHASGVPRAKLARAIEVTTRTFDAYMISHVNANKQLREAGLLWMRREWRTEEIDEILNKISMGSTVKAACAAMGYDEKKTGSFYSLMRRDPAMREWYDSARELQAESWLDDIVDIADDSSRDDYTDEKGQLKTNHGVVNRSRLMVDTRKWGMGALNRKRFGDFKHVENSGSIAVNHAVALAGARKRLEKLKSPAVIDNDTQAVVNE